MVNKIKDSKITEIREVYASGYSMEKTAKITGVYILTVFKYVKDISRPSGYQLNHTPHNKGKTKYNYKPLQSTSEKRKGMKFSKKHIKNLSDSHKGQISWCKGQKFTKEQRKFYLSYWKSLKGKYVREKHHSWKGNREIRFLIRDSYKNNDWRTKVFKRDDYICQDCGDRNGNGHTLKLNAHHIVTFSQILKFYNIKTLDDADNCRILWNIDNGVTLCERCHKTEHKRLRQ